MASKANRGGQPEPPNGQNSARKGRAAPAPMMLPPLLWVTAILLVLAVVVWLTGGPATRIRLTYGQFRQELERGQVLEVVIQGSKVYGKLAPLGEKDQPRSFWAVLPRRALEDPELDQLLLTKLGPRYAAEEAPDNTGFLITGYLLVSLLLFAAVWVLFRRSRDQIWGGSFLTGFIKSPIKRYDSTGKRVTFADVAGLEGVKEELREIVEFLKDPGKFQRVGAKVPKGVLLMGPPGTGKTLLARAVAGEAGVPFFSINGSEFIQMFVGVGASRVRDLFATAKENAPCILFIDEIDAVGRHRGAGLGGGHDEREQTLNQILSEMDGFTPNESVIVMAATNRPDILDPALLRPGRFDRHVVVDRPGFQGRLEIFKVHTRDVPLDSDVDLERLAASTVGLTGADIRNIVNEAALWAARQEKDRVSMADFEYARDKVLMGTRREDLLSGREKEMTAYHEAGHTLVVWILGGPERVHKVSVIPRARSLGATQLLPEGDRLMVSESELRRRLVYLLGGRAAEVIRFGESTAGAEDDLKKATQLARRMVMHWGMSERLGPVAFRTDEEHPFLGKEIAAPREFSEHTARVIDEETMRILRESFQAAVDVLTAHRDKLDSLAQALAEKEELDEAAIEALIGPPAYKSPPQDKVAHPVP